MAIYAFIFILAIAAGFFLFWRACRHELIEPSLAFDISIVAFLGALIGGRLVEFVVRYEQFGWSVEKLIFVNIYRGFDFWGALLGASLATFLFARRVKISPLVVYDLASAPLLFSSAVISAAKYLTLEKNFIFIIYALFYFVIFWIIKRLAAKRRHPGFFAGFYLVTLAILDIVLFFGKRDVGQVFGITYDFVVPIVILQATLVVWYVLTGRQIVADLKNFFAIFLLSILRIRRIISDANEAGKFSRSLILAPWWFFGGFAAIAKTLGREIYLGIVDFLVVLGVRR